MLRRGGPQARGCLFPDVYYLCLLLFARVILRILQLVRSQDVCNHGTEKQEPMHMNREHWNDFCHFQ